MIIPELTQFQFIVETASDYNTTFPNEVNSRMSKRVLHPRWKQRVGTLVSFCVWTQYPDDFGIDCTLSTTSKTSAATGITTVIGIKTYHQIIVFITFSSYGKNVISLSETSGEGTYISNEHIVSVKLEDEINIYGLLQFTNYVNDFDYYFDDGANWYSLWVKEASTEEVNLSTLSTVTDTIGSGTVGRATPVEGLEITINGVELWFVRKLIYITSCSDLKYNGIQYTPEATLDIDKIEDGINAYNVTISLRKRMDLI